MSEKKYEFNMEMTCGGCSGAARKVLGKINVPDDKIETHLETKKVIVTTTLTSDEILEALKKTGKTVSFVGEI